MAMQFADNFVGSGDVDPAPAAPAAPPTNPAPGMPTTVLARIQASPDWQAQRKRWMQQLGIPEDPNNPYGITWPSTMLGGSSADPTASSPGSGTQPASQTPSLGSAGAAQQPSYGPITGTVVTPPQSAYGQQYRLGDSA